MIRKFSAPSIPLTAFGYDARLHIETKTPAEMLSRRIENGTTHNEIKVRTFSIAPYGSMITNNHKKQRKDAFQSAKIGN